MQVAWCYKRSDTPKQYWDLFDAPTVAPRKRGKQAPTPLEGLLLTNHIDEVAVCSVLGPAAVSVDGNSVLPCTAQSAEPEAKSKKKGKKSSRGKNSPSSPQPTPTKARFRLLPFYLLADEQRVVAMRQVMDASSGDGARVLQAQRDCSWFTSLGNTGSTKTVVVTSTATTSITTSTTTTTTSGEQASQQPEATTNRTRACTVFFTEANMFVGR